MNRLPHCVLLAAALAVPGCAKIKDLETSAFHAQPSMAAVTGRQDPTQEQASLYLNVVGGLVTQQNYGAALAFLDDYALKQRALPPRYWLLRGDALLGSDRGPDALLAYGHLDATPLASQGWNGKGRAAAAAQQWQDAAASFRVATLMVPSNAEFLNNLAFADLHLGDNQSSVTTLRQARELDPRSTLIRNNLIVALTLTGDRGSAEKLLGEIQNASERDGVRNFVRKTVASRDLVHDGRLP
jgi:Flp pilus assembly protein TadD